MKFLNKTHKKSQKDLLVSLSTVTSHDQSRANPVDETPSEKSLAPKIAKKLFKVKTIGSRICKEK